MPEKHSTSRDQLMMLSLAEHVPEDSPARVIDAFIDAIDLEEIGFTDRTTNKEGRPAYPLDVLPKLYLYGYMHGIRTSRKLEKACQVNIELWWLLNNYKPRYKTISDFRKLNGEGFENLFVSFRNFCLKLHLYGKRTIAIDGSKFRGQNSKKNNFNQRKIDKQLEYIDSQYDNYIKELDKNDNHDPTEKLINNLDKRLDKYLDLNDQLAATEETQISTTDPDARALPLHMNIIEVGYNVQSAVDDTHNLIADFEVTNKSDHRALADMAIKTKKALKLKSHQRINVLADKGYHSGEQLQKCQDNNIKTYVAYRKKNRTNTYTCPNNKTLHYQGHYNRTSRGRITGAGFNRYKIDYEICKVCPHFEDCVSKGNKSRKVGRYIDRPMTDKAVAKNRKNIDKNKELYKKRQAIVEHPFGTIKRQWGYTYTLLKTLPKVRTEFSIIMLCYNIKRVMSILGVNELKRALNSFLNLITSIWQVREQHSTSLKLNYYLAPRPLMVN